MSFESYIIFLLFIYYIFRQNLKIESMIPNKFCILLFITIAIYASTSKNANCLRLKGKFEYNFMF